MQKIVRVREGEAIYQLDEHTETWRVVRVLDRERDGWEVWLQVLLERDEEDTARKQLQHEAYLQAVDRAFS